MAGEIPEGGESAENTDFTTETEKTTPSQKDGYVEILPDGTVKMKIEDYLKGGGVTKFQDMGSSEAKKQTQTEKEELKGGAAHEFLA